MSKTSFSDRINRLFGNEEWEKARKVLEAALVKEPESHWLITQLGVTYYEQRRYKKSLALFLRSREIVSDCPLTLWNLAGASDALGKHDEAISIYSRLIECKGSPNDESCWESTEWTAALKADCLYRLGLCYRDTGHPSEADRCFRKFIDLLLLGAEGIYSVEDARGQIQQLNGIENGARTEASQKKMTRFLSRLRSETKRRNPKAKGKMVS